MRPVNNRRSVPALMPLQRVSTIDVVGCRGIQREPRQRYLLWLLQNHCERTEHARLPCTTLIVNLKGHNLLSSTSYTRRAAKALTTRGLRVFASPPGLKSGSVQELGDLGHRAWTPAAHREKVEAEIGVAHRLGAGRARHRLGDDDRRLRAAGRRESPRE